MNKSPNRSSLSPLSAQSDEMEDIAVKSGKELHEWILDLTRGTDAHCPDVMELIEHQMELVRAIATANKEKEDEERMFPMQYGPPIPWKLASIIYVGYTALYGTEQSLQRISERGGFGWSEVEFWWKKERRFREAIDQARQGTGDVRATNTK